MDRKEAIEIVREYYPSSGKDLNEALETLIPELKESDDEIIRKALVELVRKHCVNETRCMMEEWLEKQRSRNLANSEKTCKVEPKFKVGDIMRTLQEASNGITDGMPVVVSIDNEYYRCNNEIIAIKDQDNYEYPPKNREQKPADKVEPKFKVGDWVIGRATSNEPRQISEVTDQCYKSTYGGQYGFSFEDQMHLWTIQDAKDGDILCTYECDEPKNVFILKRTSKKHYPLRYYCYCNIMHPHFDFDSEKGCLAPNDEDVKPATKEQRGFLFQKMKEAGYEWDAEKKELKQEEVDNLHNYLYGEQNPVWSEDDEANLQFAIDDFQFCVDNNQFPVVYNAEKHKEVLASLKSLKERYIWKPSNEQMSQLELIVQHDTFADQYQKEKIVTLFNDLKKLKG